MELHAVGGKSSCTEACAVFRGWSLNDHHGNSVAIELAVAKVEIGGQWGL